MQRGFSLLELSAVMVIVGLTMAALVQGYGVFNKSRQMAEVIDKQEKLDLAIRQFFTTNGRYPCPADPTLPNTDANAGRENCSLAASPVGTCTGGTSGVCKIAGARAGSNVLTGIVPYADLRQGIEKTTCISSVTGQTVLCTAPDAVDPTDTNFNSPSSDMATDPWGGIMTYAVTEILTAQNTFRPNGGTIAVETESGNALLQPAASAHYILVAHGKNKRGAYSRFGQQTTPCATGTVDAENCDNDATFINGVLSEAAGANYYDDYVKYRALISMQLWEYNPANYLYVYNTNPGNLGIRTTVPQQKLDVNGDLRSGYVQSQGLCPQGGANPGVTECWSPALFASETGTHCPPGQLVTAIRLGQFVCTPPTRVVLPTDVCTGGQFLQGINSETGIVCTP